MLPEKGEIERDFGKQRPSHRKKKTNREPGEVGKRKKKYYPRGKEERQGKKNPEEEECPVIEENHSFYGALLFLFFLNFDFNFILGVINGMADFHLSPRRKERKIIQGKMRWG